MEEKDIQQLHAHIIRLLDGKRLKEGLEAMHKLAAGTTGQGIGNAIEEIETTYQYMLQYMKQDCADPERQNLYNKLLADAYTWADKAQRARLTPISTRLYFDKLRFSQLKPFRTLSELQLEMEAYTENMGLSGLLDNGNGTPNDEISKRHEQAYSDMFHRIWLADIWDCQEEEEAHKLLSSLLVPVQDLSLFASALTLSLMEIFDSRKLLLLLDCCQHAAEEVRQRATIGAAIIIFLHDKRISAYPALSARIRLLNEDPAFAKNLNTIQIQLWRSRETKKIDKKMREEIIPEMLRNANNITKAKLDLDEDEIPEDINPEWEDWMEKSGMNDKLMEINELQMEGADIYMSTFSQLKTYPFFRDISNWFYPFDAQHSAVAHATRKQGKRSHSLLGHILQSGIFCNSDKYSFALTIAQIPEEQQKMMEAQFEAQNEANNETSAFEKMEAHSRRPDTISNQYIQDLYRFFKVHPRKQEFHDIFEEPLNLAATQTLKGAFSHAESKLNLAEYLFSKGYTAEALTFYQDIIRNNEGNDAEIFQKAGYCHQQNKDYRNAIEAYWQADSRKPGNSWTLRHLAACHKQLKQYDEALSYYKKVEQIMPDNLNTLFQIGYCLTETKHYEEALAYFFKIEYGNPQSAKAQRAVAWCSFAAGKPEQALKYYEKAISNSPQMQDYLNAGHVHWSMGHAGKAAENYAKAAKLSPSMDDFITLFNKDEEILKEAGIPQEEIPLMRDLIRYMAKQS